MLAEYDVIIVGGGMTGASLALALAGTNARIAIIEATSPSSEQQPSYDDRGLALSLSSQRVLQGLGIWDQVAATANPIRHVHVSDQHHFGFVHLHAEILNLFALGYVVLAREIGHVLLQKIKHTGNVDFICPARVTAIDIKQDHVAVEIQGDENNTVLNGKLLVAADGSQSHVCQILGIGIVVKDYRQTAIVTNVTPDSANCNTAYERFTVYGPVALLPLSEQRSAVVFTVKAEDTTTFMDMTEYEFLEKLQARFGRRLGTFRKLGTRKSYPLQLITADEQVRDRLVVLGNAAHTIHPNAAQGFNLCLRDIAGLAEILTPALRKGTDPGQRQLLHRYRDLRVPDQHNIIRFTDGLVSVFYNNLPHRVLVRNLGMIFVDLCPPLKRLFMRHAMGISGHQPALVRGLPL
jgi:2-octaprenyl-6-methoxyphenol hydroxylase